jgi:hypothetical protein
MSALWSDCYLISKQQVKVKGKCICLFVDLQNCPISEPLNIVFGAQNEALRLLNSLLEEVFRCVPLSGIEQEVLQRNFLAVLFK